MATGRIKLQKKQTLQYIAGQLNGFAFCAVQYSINHVIFQLQVKKISKNSSLKQALKKQQHYIFLQNKLRLKIFANNL